MYAEKDCPSGKLFSFNSEVTVVTVVTGASGQLGAEIVNGLTVNGARVVTSGLSLVGLKQTAMEHRWKEEYVSLHECNIRNNHAVDEAITARFSHCGEITSLVAIAGVSVIQPCLERPKSYSSQNFGRTE